MKWLKSSTAIILTLLLIEFLDEFVFGAREAAWPLIRDDLQLSYLQVSVVLGVPGIVSSIVEPVIGILGDVWRRRTLILGGGVVYALALFLVATSQSFGWLLLAFALFYPASGAFVSLSQAALMDAAPERHEQNMARWTFAGSVGIVFGPLALAGAVSLGWNWRTLLGCFAILTVFTLLVAWRSPALNGSADPKKDAQPPLSLTSFWKGITDAFAALRRSEVLRWLVLLQFADLILDILHGFLALYFVDVVGMAPAQAALGVAVWTGAGLLGDFLLIPLLERVAGLRYLRVSALLVLCIYPAFLLIEGWPLKLVLIGLLGLLNAGWYAIPKGQLYTAMPGQSGTVMMLANIFGFIGALFPLALGWIAQRFGLDIALWFIVLGPIILLLGIPRNRSKIRMEERTP
jgi:FSR family fosmidomycin resistance protein-like MFS transporter